MVPNRRFLEEGRWRVVQAVTASHNSGTSKRVVVKQSDSEAAELRLPFVASWPHVCLEKINFAVSSLQLHLNQGPVSLCFGDVVDSG